MEKESARTVLEFNEVLWLTTGSSSSSHSVIASSGLEGILGLFEFVLEEVVERRGFLGRDGAEQRNVTILTLTPSLLERANA